VARRSSIIYTARDQQIHEALALTPLDTQQLLKLSQTFEQPFTSDRKLRERMQEHAAAGWVHTFTYATTTPGQLNYYKLSADGYRMLRGHDTILPKRTAFQGVSLGLQRHTRDLAHVIVQTNVHARRLGIRIFDQYGENKLPLTLGERTHKPDYSFRLETRDGVYAYYDEIDEATEPITSTKVRESLEAKIRFHEDYQNATGERYRVRMIFAKASVRMVQFLSLARKHARQQRSIFYAVILEDYLKHGNPLLSPIFVDHFNRLQSVLPASASPLQRRLPTFAEMLAEAAAIC
jgi:hypothetical protein